MDWDLAIARNLASLLRIVETLFAMAGLRPESLQAAQPASLPRHLHAAMLAVLRPAESALRRLIVIAARNIVVVLSPAEHRAGQGAQKRCASKPGAAEMRLHPAPEHCRAAFSTPVSRFYIVSSLQTSSSAL